MFAHAHIEDFRATATHLVVSVRTDDDEARAASSPTSTASDAARRCRCPATASSRNLQSADRGELIGYTFSDADLDATGGLRERAVHRSLKDAAADDAPAQVAVAGADPRVAEWRFVPDTDSILLLVVRRIAAADRVGRAHAPTALGVGARRSTASRAARRRPSSRAPSGCVVIDLTDASEAAARRSRRTDLGHAARRHAAARTARTRAHRRACSATTGLPTGTTRRALVADDGATTPLFEAARRPTPCCRPASRRAAATPRCSSPPTSCRTRYDTYLLPLPEQLETHIVELDDGRRRSSTLAGFDDLVVPGAAAMTRRARAAPRDPRATSPACPSRSRRACSART